LTSDSFFFKAIHRETWCYNFEHDGKFPDEMGIQFGKTHGTYPAGLNGTFWASCLVSIVGILLGYEMIRAS
jgi:hypothetical protein